MATTPWDVHEQFINLVDKSTARKYAHAVALQRDMYDTGVARDVASTKFGRDLYTDELDFGQQLQRDENERQFRHTENQLERDAKQVKRGRAGHIVQPSAPAGGTTGRYTPQYAMQHLIKTGVPPIVAAGIVGNIDAESGWDPNIFEGRRRGDNGSAAYAGQWRHDRQAHLIEFGRSRGHSQPTFEDQLEFFVVEAQSGRDPGARQAMIQAGAARSPEQAAAVIMQLYERPADASSLPKRTAAARNAFNMAQGLTSAPVVADAMAVPPPGQRRVVEPTALPVTSGAPEAASVDQGSMAPQRAWTDQDFIDHNLTPWYKTAIEQSKPGLEVVDNAFYSGSQLDLVDPILRPFLFPVGGILPDETQEYLLLRPKEGVQVDANGMPIPGATGGNVPSNAIGVPPAPLPDVTQVAAQVAQAAPDASPGTQVPPPQVRRPMTGQPSPISNAPTGQRTRRNAQGQVEFNIGGEWRVSGG